MNVGITHSLLGSASGQLDARSRSSQQQAKPVGTIPLLSAPPMLPCLLSDEEERLGVGITGGIIIQPVRGSKYLTQFLVLILPPLLYPTSKESTAGFQNEVLMLLARCPSTSFKAAAMRRQSKARAEGAGAAHAYKDGLVATVEEAHRQSACV